MLKIRILGANLKGSLIPIVFLWAGAVTFGMWRVLDYEKTPAAASVISDHWPAQAGIPLDANRPTLVLFIHPHCPCTKATLSELSVLMANCRGKLSTYLFFLKPAGFVDDWSKSDLWLEAGKIPGTKLALDDNGVIARNFNAATSGQCLLYDPKGILLFQGGITGMRGHAGDNIGRRSITSIIWNEKPASRKTFVYGCSLFNESPKNT